MVNDAVFQIVQFMFCEMSSPLIFATPHIFNCPVIVRSLLHMGEFSSRSTSVPTEEALVCHGGYLGNIYLIFYKDICRSPWILLMSLMVDRRVNWTGFQQSLFFFHLRSNLACLSFVCNEIAPCRCSKALFIALYISGNLICNLIFNNYINNYYQF